MKDEDVEKKILEIVSHIKQELDYVGAQSRGARTWADNIGTGLDSIFEYHKAHVRFIRRNSINMEMPTLIKNEEKGWQN